MELDPGFAGVTKTERDHLLHRAVAADRKHLADPGLHPDDYLNAALELMAYDRRYGTWAPGLPGPGSATWSDDDGPLEYVRAQRRHHETQ
jgi:hypothetical protein